MGVYQRKNKRGKHFGPYIVQYPCEVNPITGKTIWKTCCVHGSKTQAKTVYGEKLLDFEKKKHLKLETKKEYTFCELLDWYLDHPKARRKKTYSRDIEMSIILKEHFGVRFAGDIKPTEIERFQDKMLKTPSKRGTPYKPATVNRFVTLIKRAYNLAIRDEMVGKNPCWKVPLLPERNARNRIVSPEEFEKLIKELPEYGLVLSMGYHLGMREGEILNLREKQIHFLGKETYDGYIELYDGETKTGEGRQIPFVGSVCNLLRHHLEAKRKHGPEEFVFTTGNGKLHRNFRRAFQRACRRSCLEEDTCEKKDPKTCRSCEQKGIKGLCFHDTRHTAITNLRKAGVNISVIMAISGHKTMAMFKRYNRIDLNDGREAMQRLERYLSQTGTQRNQEVIERKEDQTTEDFYCNITATRKNGEIAYA